MIRKTYNLMRSVKNNLVWKVLTFKDNFIEPNSSVFPIELKILKKLAVESKVMIDVGARSDIFFAEYKSKDARVFLIEGNPKHFKFLSKKISRLRDVSVVASNIFVSDVPHDTTTYFPKSQSLMKNRSFVIEKPKLLSVQSMRLDDYFRLNRIEHVDFLKIDIEYFDYHALVSCGEFLPKMKFLQFELSIGAPFRNRIIMAQDFLDLLVNNFSLFLMRDDDNPIWRDGIIEVDLIELDATALSMINILQEKGIGFNVFSVSRANALLPEELSIGALNLAQVAQITEITSELDSLPPI